MKKRFIFLMGIALLSSYSCQKKNLYPISQTSVSNQDGQPFSTAARILAQVQGLYLNTRNGQTYGGRYQIYNDIKADNWINATSNSITGYQTWSESVSSTSGEVLNLWSQGYLNINNCNLFIDGMAASGSAVAGASLAANYVGEAKYLRAINYYALLEMYCPPYGTNSGASPALPLRLKGNSTSGNYDLAPSSVAKIFAQIISDLNDAEAGLPLTYSNAATNTTRAHKNTAIAFKTRVYLAMGQYTNVITEANKIVSASAPFTATAGVAFALQPTIANVFKSPYTTSESIFSEPFLSTETQGTQNQPAYYFYINGTQPGVAEYYLNPTGVIGDANWLPTDQRKGFIFTSTYSATAGNKYLLKYTAANPYIDWIPVQRYSEVLLNLAEARVRSTSTLDAQAIALLNAVRGRSDPSTVYTAASFPGGSADLIAAIMEERNIEFLGEGLRWNDLWRLSLPIPAKSNIAQITSTNSNYVWPMSGNEQIYNHLIGR